MKKKPVLLRLFGYLKGWWGLGFFFGLGTSASQSFLTTLVVALGLKNMTDAILAGAMSVLLSATLKVVLAFIGIYAILPFVWYLFYRASQEIHRNLLYDLYEHIQLLPIRYMENNHSGDLISRITNDTEPLRDVCGEHMKGIVQLSIAGIGNAITIFILDWRLGIGAISIGLVTLLSNIIFAKPLRRVGKQNQEALSDTTQRLSDIIAGRKVMKIFGLEKTAMGKFILANERALAASLKRVRLSTVNQTITHFVHSAAESGFIAVGAIFVIQGTLTFGTLLATLAMIHRIIWMFRGFGQYATRIQRILAGADRVFDLLDEPAESINPPRTEPWTWRKEHRRKNGPAAPTDNFAAPRARTPDIPADTPAVEIHEVGFAYDPEMPVIQDLSLVIAQIERLAIVGTSGGGKSTLMKLLLRLHEFEQGRILVYGKPIDSYDLEAYRDLIAYVPQDTYLFDTSIRDNIGFGRLGSGEDEIVGCSKAAHAHAFISELPDGYDTLVGERGIHLSVGQRQRLAIARALLKDAPLLILDEATASLDSESENEVQAALEELMKNRTSIVIAHRLSTIQQADRIVVIEKGRIHEIGSHEDLLALNGRYAELHAAQFI